MKRKFYSVLRSQTGASITFALLLFLICSLVGALVITAGTTAAGRMANLAEMDQRYYSVSSAANLLADELNNSTVKITRVRKLSTVTVTEYATEEVEGRTVATVVGSGSTTYAWYSTSFNDQIVVSDPEEMQEYNPDGDAGDSLPEDEFSFLTGRAAVLLLDDTCNNDSAMEASMKNGVSQHGQFSLTHEREGGGVTDQNLAISGTFEMKSDGTLVLTLHNTNGDPYLMRVTLTASISETKSENTTADTSREYLSNGFMETVNSTRTLTKVSEITWTVSGVEKVVSS